MAARAREDVVTGITNVSITAAVHTLGVSCVLNVLDAMGKAKVDSLTWGPYVSTAPALEHDRMCCVFLFRRKEFCICI